MNIFIGVPQSKYAAIAILVALVFVAFAMVFGKDQVPVGQKFLFVLVMFVIALPSILFTLFQLTCLVTGAGGKNQRWWCSAYSWIGTIFIILYSVIIVVVGIASLVNGSNVMSDINNVMTFEQMKNMADMKAAEYFQDMDAAEKEGPNPLTKMMAGETPEMFQGTMLSMPPGKGNTNVRGPNGIRESDPKPDAVPEERKEMDKKRVGKMMEGFQVPEPVPEETEADKAAKRMDAAAAASASMPTPAEPEGFANFAMY